MWRSLSITVGLVILFLGGVQAEAYTPCAEDGRTYHIAKGETITGSLTAAAKACADGSATLQIVQSPLPPTLVAPMDGWSYVVAVDAYHVFSRFVIKANCDGVEVCQATLTYQSKDSPTKPTDAPTSNKKCFEGNTTVRHYHPGRTYLGPLPLAHKDAFCAYSAVIQPPSIGLVQLLSPEDPLSYVYVSPWSDAEANTTLRYSISCNSTLLCEDVVYLVLSEVAPACPNDLQEFDVLPSNQLMAELQPGAACAGELSVRPHRTISAEEGELTFINSLTFLYTAPATETILIQPVRVYCDMEALCDLSLIMDVTLNTRPPDTPPPAGGGSVSTCPEVFQYQVPIGETIRGIIRVQVNNGCQPVIYAMEDNHTDRAGRLQVNSIGDFVYQAASTEVLDVWRVNASCGASFECHAQLSFTVYRTLTEPPLPTPTTSAPVVTDAPTPRCADVYYYQTAPSVLLHGSLLGMAGEEACAQGRLFSLNTVGQGGQLKLMAEGDFEYSPPDVEGLYGFTFFMYCIGKVQCVGSAYIVVSHREPPITTTMPPHSSQSSSDGPSVSLPPQIACRGTCNREAWMTYPAVPIWDVSNRTAYTRQDGRPVDSIQVSWANSSIIITAYALIGNLGIRFPTFEPLHGAPGSYLDTESVQREVATTSPAFDLRCLAHQGYEGLGDDVWRWSSLTLGNGTGSVGPLYASGRSWYQKFGGKHVHCDVFADPCHYAPLLTPVQVAEPMQGRWTVGIGDCDVTWTGTFPVHELLSMTKSDGSPVWSHSASRRLKGTVYSEAVRPASWTEPSLGIETNFTTHDIFIDFDHVVEVAKTSITGVPPQFSLDVEFFEFAEVETGNAAFGVNLLLYPYLQATMPSGDAPDRRVVGFRWIDQEWTQPSDTVCPTCSGTQMRCRVDGYASNASFTGEFFPGNCPDGVGRVTLRKGPAMTEEDCPLSGSRHLLHTPGFSAPHKCSATYQNITVRGVLPGSASLTEEQKQGLRFLGTMVLQLLMADGSRVDLRLQLGLGMVQLSQGTFTEGRSLLVCRGGNYWPVLDPLGTSLPDRPFELSAAEPTPLCIDGLSSVYGPSDWALVTLNIPGAHPDDLLVHAVYVVLGGQRVYLLYRDPVTAHRAVPPAGDGHYWQHTHPFLAFRDLSERVTNHSLTCGSAVPDGYLKDAVFAFAFIPGALHVDSSLEITVETTITSPVTSHSIFRRVVLLDPLLTQLSRQGPPAVPAMVESTSRSDLYALGAIAGVAVVLVATALFYVVADNNRPLPRWVPRAQLVKRTVLEVLPPGLRGMKSKRVVHRDMYDAMASGRY